MASCSSTLPDRDISQVTDIISAKNRYRFSVDYLGIDRNEYNTIEAEAGFIHHDALFECIARWKNKTEAEGKDAKQELIRILMNISKQHGWISTEDMIFLTNVIKINPHSKSIYFSQLRVMNGDVLRNITMYSFPKLCPVYRATWLNTLSERKVEMRYVLYIH